MSTSRAEGRWQVPSTWKWVTAKEIASIAGGGTPETSDPANFSEDGTPWITPADLSDFNGVYIRKGRRNLSEKGIKRSAARILPKGTVLYSSRAPIGYCVIAENPIATNQGFKSLVLRAGIDPRFVRYYLLASKEYANRIASGTTFRELSGARMAEFPIPLAPTDEQERIVAKIDELFTRLDAADTGIHEASKLLKSYRNAVLASAVDGRLSREYRRNVSGDPGSALLAEALAYTGSKTKRVPNTSEPLIPDLPKGWCWATLDQLSWSSNYGTSVKCSYAESGVCVLRIPNIRNAEINFSDLKFATSSLDISDDDLVKAGDLLIIRTNGSENIIGRGAVLLRRPERKTYFASYLIRFRLALPEILGPWLNLVWQNPIMRHRLMKIAATSAGQYNVSQTNLAKIAIPIPPLQELLHIVKTATVLLDAVDKAEMEIRERISSVGAFRQSILSAAFRGELVPRDASDEPAEKLLERIRAQRAPETVLPKLRPRRQKVTA